MALAKSRGTLSPSKIPTATTTVVPPSQVEEVCEKGIIINPTPQEQLDSETYVKNTLDNLNAVDEEANILAMLAQYATGSTINVTWYHHMNIETFGRSFEIDLSAALDNVHYCFLKIHNFQMKLVDDFQFEYSTDVVTSAVTGSAILYPYFVPYQGDLFLYEVETGHIGLFKVSEAPERLSIKEGTCHKIKFNLVAWLTDDLLKKLNDCVEDEAYFDLDRFLSTNGSLLTSDENKMLGEVNKWLNLLMSWYCDNFYDKPIYRTFVQDGCSKELIPYDPYLVEFISRIIPYIKMPGYPTQLVSDPKHWKQSLWFKLLDPEMVPDEILISKAEICICEITYRTTRVNALANRPYYKLRSSLDADTEQYPFFTIPEAYDNAPEKATIPMQVKLYFDQGKVRPCYLLPLCKDIFSYNRKQQFYFTPILIFLLRKTYLALKRGTSNVILLDK